MTELSDSGVMIMSHDLRVPLAISEYEARAGTARVLTLPDRSSVTVLIPAGVYEGQELHFPGQAPVTGSSGQPGTLTVTLSVLRASPHAQPESPVSLLPLPPIELASPLSSGQPPLALAAQPTQPPPPPLAGTPSLPSSPSLPGIDGSSPNLQPGYPSPAYQLPQTRRSSGKMIALIVVVVVLTLCPSGIFLAVQRVQMNAATTAAATATGVVNATSTAQVSAQLTAQADSATAVANATATAVQATAAVADANPDPYGLGGKLVVLDSLDGSHSSGWTTASGCGFQGGAYHVHESGAGRVQPCYYQKYSFKNFVVEVKMTILAGNVGGLFIRGDGYFLSVDVDNSYCQLARYDFDKNAPVALVRPNDRTPAIRAGQNTIAMVAQGSQLTWYINSQLVGSASDNIYNIGLIGLAAGTYATSGKSSAEVTYTMFRVWAL